MRGVHYIVMIACLCIAGITALVSMFDDSAIRQAVYACSAIMWVMLARMAQAAAHENAASARSRQAPGPEPADDADLIACGLWRCVRCGSANLATANACRKCDTAPGGRP